MKWTSLKFWERLQPKQPGWQVGAALLFIAAGFIVIGIAWNGAASIDFAQGQLPYLLSGGAVGLGLIGIGITLLIFEAARRSRVHLDDRLGAIVKALEDIRSTAPGTSSNGSRVVPTGAVVAGRSSYHSPDCRLVQGKEDLVYVSLDEATQRGLSPCRVCAPDVLVD
jgi:hypothetical protein